MPLVAALLSVSLAFSPQTQGEKEKLANPKPKVVQASGYVTQAEAKQVFARAEQVIRKVTKSQAKVPAIALGASAKPATRTQFVTEFARLYDIAKPKFKLIPKPVIVDTTVLKMSDANAKARLQLLVRRGAVANFGPLAAGPDDMLTPQEFGDALGFFLARMAEMTNMPNRFTPAIMPKDGN